MQQQISFKTPKYRFMEGILEDENYRKIVSFAGILWHVLPLSSCLTKYKNSLL